MKKFLATVTAVVLAFAMVALPSISATAVAQTCNGEGYNKPAALDASSGNVDIYDGATLIGNLTWSGTSVTYDLEPGWSIDLCIKSGSQTGDVEGDKITTFPDLTGSGSTKPIDQNISHIGYLATYTPPTPTTVVPEYSSGGEVCDEESGFIAGFVNVTLKTGIVYVLYTQTGQSGTQIDIADGTSPVLLPGTYYLSTLDANPSDLFTAQILTDVVITILDEPTDCAGVQPTPVVPAYSSGGETCDEESVFIAGFVNVTLKAGVVYSLYPLPNKNGTPIDIADGTSPDLAPGSYYLWAEDADPSDLFTVSGPILDLKITILDERLDCIQLEDHPDVIPSASQDPGCELPSFFTIGNNETAPGADPAAVFWTANGEPIEEGTHVVSGKTTITLVATANGPTYGFNEETQTLWTFAFPADETCDLTTLALTGSSDTTPALALTAFLGLLGLAMVRSGIRVNRIRQEA